MSEPASLFDIGMLRLERALDRGGLDGGLDAAYRMDAPSVSYEWDTDRIIIRLDVDTGTEPTKAAMQEVAKRIISNVRQSLGVNPETGAAYEGQSYLTELFSHRGYHTDLRTEILVGLDPVTEIHVSVVSSARSKGRPTGTSLSCRASLLGTAVRFDGK
jgi:hypothetical protein